MPNTEVRAITWAQARATRPAKINVVCDQQNSVYEDAVRFVLERLLAAEQVLDDVEIVARWVDRDDPVLHCGSVESIDDDANVVFTDGIAVPLHVIVSASI